MDEIAFFLMGVNAGAIFMIVVMLIADKLCSRRTP